jgi:hypothetical protein
VNFLQLYTQAGNASLVNDVPLAKQAVNDAIEEITAECAFNMTESALLNLTGGTYQYSFTTLIAAQPLKVHYVKYFPAGSNPISQVLMPITLEELLELQNNVGGVYGSGVFCVPDYDKLWLYPTPSAGDTCRLYYSAVVTDLVADGDVPVVIQPRLHYLITYVAARNLAIVNNAAMVAELEPLAQLAITKLRTDKNMYGSRRGMRARVGMPDTNIVRDRSQYYSGDG